MKCYFYKTLLKVCQLLLQAHKTLCTDTEPLEYDSGLTTNAPAW